MIKKLTRFLFLALLFSAVLPAEDGGILREIEQLISADKSPSAEKSTTAITDKNATAASVMAQTGAPALRVRVTAKRHTILAANISGRIEEITVRDGERFTNEQMLVRQNTKLFELQRERGRAALRRQELLLQMTQELADMQTKGEVELNIAKSEREQALADLGVVEEMIARAKIIAPFAGRVAEIFAREKQYVAEGQPLLEILDDTELELEFIVASLWLRWLKPEHKFNVKIDETGATYSAIVKRIGGKVDPLSQSVKIYADLIHAPSELMEGMSGEAMIETPK